jgi:hypothetical protein
MKYLREEKILMCDKNINEIVAIKEAIFHYKGVLEGDLSSISKVQPDFARSILEGLIIAERKLYKYNKFLEMIQIDSYKINGLE